MQATTSVKPVRPNLKLIRSIPLLRRLKTNLKLKTSFAKEVTVGGVTTILRNAIEISPSIAALPIADTWAGLRPRSADGLPVLGPCGEIDGLVFATGHYRNGILLAPVTGELIASAIVQGFVPRELAPFSPDRFAARMSDML